MPSILRRGFFRLSRDSIVMWWPLVSRRLLRRRVAPSSENFCSGGRAGSSRRGGRCGGGSAVAESPADVFSVWSGGRPRASRGEVPRVGKHHAAEADEVDPAFADGPCRDVGAGTPGGSVGGAGDDEIGNVAFQLAGDAKLAVDADERVFGGQVAVGRGEQRGAWMWGIVVGAAGGEIDERDVELFQEREELDGFGEIDIATDGLVYAEAPVIGNCAGLWFRERRGRVFRGDERAGSGWNGAVSKAERRTPILQRGSVAAYACAWISRRKRVRFSKLPPYLPSR